MIKRCMVCWNTYDDSTVSIPPRDKDNYQWWVDDLANDTFKDYPETPGICSVKCLHKHMREVGEE